MPSTVNGIGTHYYGKKNLQKRPGPCPHCGRPVELASYDTRLWFVIVFIPIIPLARKRIIDYCSACTRHYAMEADKWETAKQLEVSGAMDKFRADGTPEDAIAAHQQMINFHQFEQAAEFRKTMLEKFSDNAKVQAYLGASLGHLGKLADADGFYARALELRPDMPEARIGVARGHIRAGKLDEGRTLLDFLEKPGASQLYSLEPLDTLARAYQNAGRHNVALELLGVIQKELPKLAEEKWFRKLVEKSEKSVGRTESQLPKLKFSWKRLFSAQNLGAAEAKQNPKQLLLVLGVIFALIALGFVIANEYIRRHRTLHIVNGFAQPATVRIDGLGEFKSVRGHWTTPLAEGRYHIVITGPAKEELDIDVREGYFSRWTSDPAWVLNVGGGAILIRTTAIYRRDPLPPTITFHFGKTFEYFPEITHPFEALPETVRIESGSSRTLVELQLFQGEAASVFGYYADKHDTRAALEFAENWLRLHFDDEQMIRQYAATAKQTRQSARLNDFLRAGLAERPVRIEWHRVYQGLHDTALEHTALIYEYSKLLDADPTNSALLYLRGRIESDRPVSVDYFQRAAKADPQNPFPQFALSFDRMAAGDWEGARPFADRARELRPRDPSLEHWQMLIRFALGEYSAIEKDARQQISAEPDDIQANIRLIDVLVAQSRRDDVLAVCDTFQRTCVAKYKNQSHAVVSALRAHAMYALGDFAALEKIAASQPVGSARTLQFQALIEQGRIADAVKLLPREGDDEQPVTMLALTVAYRLAGETAEANRWCEQARQLMAKGDEDLASAAKLLNRGTLPTSAETSTVVVAPDLKALLLTELALEHPQARKELAALARHLNVQRVFPYHLIQKATAEAF